MRYIYKLLSQTLDINPRFIPQFAVYCILFIAATPNKPLLYVWLTSKPEQFIFVPNCTEAVNLLKLPPVVYMISRSYDHGCMKPWTAQKQNASSIKDRSLTVSSNFYLIFTDCVQNSFTAGKTYNSSENKYYFPPHLKGELDLDNKWKSDDLFYIIMNKIHPRFNQFCVILKLS